ncbi:MAG TPA: hypothetical protein VF406_07675 [Thermodesulfobacteriota bacterium]
MRARRLAFGQAGSWPPLDSRFGNLDREPEQAAAVRRLVGEPPEGGDPVPVTHRSSLSALTGVYPASGEAVVPTPRREGRFTAAGRLSPADLD